MSHTTLLVHQNVHEREKDCTFVSFCLQVPDVHLLHLLFICSWMRLLAWAVCGNEVRIEDAREGGAP